MGVVLILEVGLHLELLNDTTKQWLKLNNFFFNSKYFNKWNENYAYFNECFTFFFFNDGQKLPVF